MANYISKNRVGPMPREWASVRLARIEDVPGILAIYKDVYNGTYPYAEYLDETFLRNDISCDHSSWYVVEDTTCNRMICGCASLALDVNDRRAYTRGLMMRPEWQGRGGTTGIFGHAFQYALRQYAGRMRIFWGEARSASAKPQAVAESVGMIPIGILASKDIFFDKRETVILMANYFDLAWQNRDPDVCLVPPVEPAYNYVKTLFAPLKNEIARVEPLRLENLKSESRQVNVITSKSNHGYTLHVFTDKKTGESASIIVNNLSANAEHMELRCSSPVVLRGLLDCMIKHLQNEGIKYIEGYCPAKNPGFQEAFLMSGLRPIGYAPAWTCDPLTNKFTDQIVFGWVRDPVTLDSMGMSSKTAALANALQDKERGTIP